ncbi:hypothetical protein V8C34DRAFT_326720 [Trichoderma compactum]
MPPLLDEPEPLPTPPGSPVPWTSKYEASLQCMPPEIIMRIMGFTDSRLELINLALSSSYLSAVLRMHEVMKDGETVWQCLYALSQRPTVDTIRDLKTLRNMVDLTAYINTMVTIYTYPRQPDPFWRHALRKYANRWPDGCVPDGQVSIDPSTREELRQVATRLWNVRDAALGYRHGSAPRINHSKEFMALYQREMFCAELKLRCDLVSERGFGIPEWMNEETPGDGCWNRDDGEVWTEMNQSSWAEGRALGIRFYITIATYMPKYARREDIYNLCVAIQGQMWPLRYPELCSGTPIEWFFEFQEAAWEGLWEHAHEYCRQLDNGLVDDIGGGTDYF